MPRERPRRRPDRRAEVKPGKGREPFRVAGAAGLGRARAERLFAAVGLALLAAGLSGCLLVFGSVSLARLVSERHRYRAGLIVAEVARAPSDAPLPAPDRGPLLSALEAGDTPVAVVVDNHVAARPPAGLEGAAVVYEAPVEGGITRFLAVFALARLPAVIGPVRSVRPYLVDWAEEWGAAVFHSGGSPDGVRRMRLSAVPDIDEISWHGRYFWRENARAKPHNLFTSAPLIRQAFDDDQLPTAVAFSPFAVAREAPLEERPFDGFAVTLAAADPKDCVRYRYQRISNRYERWQGDVPHRTADGAPLHATSVVVQEVPGNVIDRAGRLALAVDAGGWALVLANGQTRPAVWERRRGTTRYVEPDGREAAFPVGPVWVTIVLDRSAVRLPPATPGCG